MWDYGDGWGEEECESKSDFDLTMNDLIEQEVDKKVKEKVQDYNRMKEKFNKIKDEKYKADIEISRLSSDLEDAETNFYNKGIKDGKREILNGFYTGDKVWIVKTIRNQYTCETCSGDSKINADFNGRSVTVECPDCRYGRITDIRYEPVYVEISEIDVKVWAKGKRSNVEVYVDKIDNKDSDIEMKRFSDLFKTKEECEVKIKELEQKNQ